MRKLTKPELIEWLADKGVTVEGSSRLRVIDNEGNPLAPERYCYKIYWSQHGIKRGLAVWPNTVGYQGL